MGKTGHIAKNVKFAVAGELLLAALKFISRRVFVVLLGKEYLGLNGLFTDILSMLSLAELGFSTSITYSLYRPVAQGDTQTIQSLMRLYRRVYQVVAVAVLLVGLALTPFLGFFVKEMPKDIPYIPLFYILSLLNASVSYFFAYKSTLLLVDQRKYIETTIRGAVSLAATLAQILVLYLTGSYLYYLLLSIGATLAQNIIISARSNQLYPFLKEKKAQPLPKKTLDEIRRNVHAMLLHRIGGVAVFNTDNLLISKFVGVAAAGLYSNYMMIRGFLNIVIRALFDVITPAMGNLSATGPEERMQAAFRRLNFFSGWLFGWMSVSLLCLYDPFIDLWLGEGYRLPGPAVLLLVVNFYMSSMRVPVDDMKGVLGLFWEDRYKSLLEAAFNLVVSLALAQRYEVAGILAGTLASTLALPFWWEPLVLYRRGLHMPVWKYFVGYSVQMAVTAAAGGATWLLCSMMGDGIGGFLLKALLCLAVPNGVYLVVYSRTEELAFLKEQVRKAVKKRFLLR